MFIQAQPLDDPTLMKFTPGEPVLPLGNEPIGETQSAVVSPLARRLLRIDGVEGVSLSLDDVTLRRADNITTRAPTRTHGARGRVRMRARQPAPGRPARDDKRTVAFPFPVPPSDPSQRRGSAGHQDRSC